MKRLILILALVGAVVPSALAGHALLKVRPRHIDFHEVTIGTTASRVITMTNRGAQPVTVAGFDTLPDDFSLSLCFVTLAPRESCTIDLTFTPSSQFAEQHQHGTITVQVVNPVGGAVLEGYTVTVKGEGEPAD